MEQENSQQSLEQKIDKLQNSIDKLNKMFKWTLIITLVLFIVPLIGLLFVVPKFLSNIDLTNSNYSELLK
ncbi:MAG: hypothetical protein Q7R99_02835 [bacterium]|nr:hypothetical protein [bacterium]